MKISIIMPIYKDGKELDKFLDNIRDQTAKNYEIVLVIDTTIGDTLSIVDKHSKKLKTRLKVIFNSKRASRTSAIFLGTKVAKGKYSIIMSPQNLFNDKFIENATKVLTKKPADIVEFKSKISSPIKYSGEIRKTFNKPVKIEEHPEINAFTSPFDFNKFIKTAILEKASKYKLPVQFNSRFSLDATYLSILVADTYATESKTFITSKSKTSPNFNPMKMIRQWESLIKLVEDYFSEENIDSYVYAQYFSESVFMSAIVKTTKNKIVIKKFNEVFKKQQAAKFKEIFSSNKYSSVNTKERRILLKYSTISTLPKAHKDFK